jgi:hypothetical protein
MAGEDQHLPFARLIGDEFDQHAGCGPGPLVIKIHECVVHDERQRHAMPLQVADERQPQCQEHLFSRAAAEPLRLPDRPVAIVYLEPRLVDCGGDRRVAAVGEAGQPV